MKAAFLGLLLVVGVYQTTEGANGPDDSVGSILRLLLGSALLSWFAVLVTKDRQS